MDIKKLRGISLPQVSENAYTVVQEVLDTGKISGMIGIRVQSVRMSVERLADCGVPDNLDLPFDSDKLRSEIQELAQFIVD